MVGVVAGIALLAALLSEHSALWSILNPVPSTMTGVLGGTRTLHRQSYLVSSYPAAAASLSSSSQPRCRRPVNHRWQIGLLTGSFQGALLAMQSLGPPQTVSPQSSRRRQVTSSLTHRNKSDMTRRDISKSFSQKTFTNMIRCFWCLQAKFWDQEFFQITSPAACLATRRRKKRRAAEKAEQDARLKAFAARMPANMTDSANMLPGSLRVQYGADGAKSALGKCRLKQTCVHIERPCPAYCPCAQHSWSTQFHTLGTSLRGCSAEEGRDLL